MDNDSGSRKVMALSDTSIPSANAKVADPSLARPSINPDPFSTPPPEEDASLRQWTSCTERLQDMREAIVTGKEAPFCTSSPRTSTQVPGEQQPRTPPAEQEATRVLNEGAYGVMEEFISFDGAAVPAGEQFVAEELDEVDMICTDL